MWCTGVRSSVHPQASNVYRQSERNGQKVMVVNIINSKHFSVLVKFEYVVIIIRNLCHA